MTPLERAALDFERMMRSGSLDGIILYDLIQTYKYQHDGGEWELKDALRKVIRYYATNEQYEQFREEVGIE